MAENPLLQYLDVETPPPVQTTDTDSTANPLLQYIETTEEPKPTVETPKESGFQKFLDQAFVQPASSFIVGYFRGSAGITDTLDKYAKYITNLTGIEKPKVMENLTKFYNTRAEEWEKSGIPEGQGFVNDLGKALYEGAGIFGIDLPVIASMGQWGLPIYSAIKGGGETAEAHDNIIKTALSPATGIIKGGIEGTALHLTLGAFSNLSRPLAQIGAGGTFAGLTAWEQALTQDEIDWSEVTAQGMLGVGLTLTQGKPSQLGQQFKKGKTNFVKYVKDKGISEKKAERFYDELKKNEVEIQPSVKEQIDKLVSEGKLTEKQTEEVNLIKDNLEITLKRIENPSRTETQKNQDINSAKQMTNIIQEQIPGFETPELLRDKTEPVSEKKIERIAEKEKPAEKPIEEPIEPIEVKFEPEVESRFQASKGVKKEGVFSKIKDQIESLKNKTTREFEFLARNQENAEIAFALRKLSKQKNVSADKTVRFIDDIVKDLSPKEYDLFTRKVILDDLAATVRSTPKDEAIPQLPYGLKPETLNIELAKVNRALEQNPKIQDKINLRKQNFKELKDEYIQLMDDIGFNVENKLQRDDYFRHMVLEHAGSGVISGAGKKLKAPTRSKFLSKRRGSEKDINSDYIEAEFDVVSQMLYDMQVAKTIKVVDENYNIYDAVRAQAKAETGSSSNWKDFVPEGYRTWQPREGNVFYISESVPTKVANQLFEKAMEGKGISKKDLQQVSEQLVVGGKRKEFVIKEDVAKTLDNLSKDAPVKGLPTKILSSWKRLQLVSPRRYFKYNLRNLSGDAEGAFIGNPSTFKEVPKAVKDLIQAFTGEKKMTPELREWFERGGMESTLQAQELGDLKTLDTFSNKYKKTNKVEDIPVNIWKGYWNKAKISTDFREAILRYASYLDYKNQMLKNPDRLPDNYGASIRNEVQGLSDVRDKAFMLSNDLLGAYDRISVVGQSVRESLIPFWSFQETNAIRFKRLVQNAASDNKIATQVGKKVLGKAANPMTYMRIGSFIIKASAIRAGMEAWNQTQFPEEEKSLPESVRNRPHIITGVSEDGKVQYIDRLGITSDFLEWFGLDAAPQLVNDYLNGRKSEKEIALEIAKSPVKKVVNGVNPFLKTPLELLARKQLFPDPFDPQNIRDRAQYLARQFTLIDEYKALFDIPSEGYATSLKKAIVSEVDPQRAAYNDVISRKYEYLKKIGKPPGSSPNTPKSNALYNLKNAIRYNNPKQAAKYYIEYRGHGGTNETLDDSIDRLNPLSGFPKDDPIQAGLFLKYLGQDGRDRLRDALEYYKQEIVDVKQGAEFNKKVNQEIEKIISQLK
tara:strand:+ start:1275 stop:5231 length:3957 start_codon:yes stop_codon:yes gene_type:complete